MLIIAGVKTWLRQNNSWIPLCILGVSTRDRNWFFKTTCKMADYNERSLEFFMRVVSGGGGWKDQGLIFKHMFNFNVRKHTTHSPLHFRTVLYKRTLAEFCVKESVMPRLMHVGFFFGFFCYHIVNEVVYKKDIDRVFLRSSFWILNFNLNLRNFGKNIV